MASRPRQFSPRREAFYASLRTSSTENSEASSPKAPAPAAPKEREEPPTWREKFRLAGLLMLSVLFILAGGSLLFIIPILVDPILVGLEANFDPDPAMCRTVEVRNGTDPTTCLLPSCREGCTADIFFCFFIHVVYSLAEKKKNVSSSSAQTLPSKASSSFNESIQGVLLINPNGCGYPPTVSCVNFLEEYGEGNEFPCFYSRVNHSLLVSSYSREAEITRLFLSLGFPLSVGAVASIGILFLVRWNPESHRAQLPAKAPIPPPETNAGYEEYLKGKRNRSNEMCLSNGTKVPGIENEMKGETHLHNGHAKANP